MSKWRTGSKVPINVYDGDRPVCQCHNPEDAARIVAALNGAASALGFIDEFPEHPAPADIPIEDLGVGVRAYNVLNAMNIKTVSEIIAAGRKTIFRRSMCGRKTIADIEYELNKGGWRFAVSPVELGARYVKCLKEHRLRWAELDAHISQPTP